MRRLAKILLLSGTLSLWGCGHSLTAPELVPEKGYQSLTEAFSEYIPRMMQERHVTGLSLALVDDQETVWEQGFGFADLKDRVQAAPQTVYQAGSISKLFVAAAIMQLVEQGKIGLDQPVKTYLPEFNPKTRFAQSGPITVRQLLTHHSGLACDYNFASDQSQPRSMNDYLEAVNSLYTAFPPGYMFSYSNLGMDILGLVVERVSGEKFEDYQERHLFTPLGMARASFVKSPQVESALSKGYHRHQLLAEREWNGVVPAGSLYASAEDLAKFIKMVLAQGLAGKKQILASETLAEMFTPQNPQAPLDAGEKMGLAWRLSRPELEYAGEVCHHGGSTGIFYGDVAVLPGSKIGVVVLSNSTGGDAVCKPLADEILRAALKIKNRLSPPNRQASGQNPPPQDIPFTDEQLRQWPGAYALSGNGLAKVERRGQQLRCTLNGKAFQLIAQSDQTIAMQTSLLGIFPWRIKDYSASLMAYQGDGVILIRRGGVDYPWGVKTTSTVLDQAWLERTGSYQQLGNDANTCELKIQDGFLIWANHVLEVQNDHEAVILGFDRGFGGQTVIVETASGKEVLNHAGWKHVKREPRTHAGGKQ